MDWRILLDGLELLNLALQLCLFAWNHETTVLQHAQNVLTQVEGVVRALAKLRLRLSWLEKLLKVVERDLLYSSLSEFGICHDQLAFFSILIFVCDSFKIVSQEHFFDAVVLALGTLFYKCVFFSNHMLLSFVVFPLLLGVDDIDRLLGDGKHQRVVFDRKLDNCWQFGEHGLLQLPLGCLKVQIRDSSPLAFFRARQHAHKISVNEVDIRHEWSLFKTDCLLVGDLSFGVDPQVPVDHLQVKDPVRPRACSEHDATRVIARLSEASGLLVPKLQLLAIKVFRPFLFICERRELVEYRFIRVRLLTEFIFDEKGHILSRRVEQKFIIGREPPDFDFKS